MRKGLIRVVKGGKRALSWKAKSFIRSESTSYKLPTHLGRFPPRGPFVSSDTIPIPLANTSRDFVFSSVLFALFLSPSCPFIIYSPSLHPHFSLSPPSYTSSALQRCPSCHRTFRSLTKSICLRLSSPPFFFSRATPSSGQR